jgi:fatty acid desaturase
MLSRHDRVVLRGMESALSADAPDLAASFDEWRVKTPRKRRRASAVVIWLAVALMLAGLALASAVVFWLSALVVGSLLGVGHWRRRMMARRHPHG